MSAREQRPMSHLSVSHIIHMARRLPLRFPIVSCPESHICEAFEEPFLASITQMSSLYGDFQSHDDVSTYLRSEFSRIYDSKGHRDVMESVRRPWPSDDVIKPLTWKSGGYLIYASTVIRFIDEEFFSPADRLDQVLNCSNPSISAPFAELDKLYIQILSFCPKSQIPLLERILGYAVSTRFQPQGYRPHHSLPLSLAREGEANIARPTITHLIRWNVGTTQTNALRN